MIIIIIVVMGNCVLKGSWGERGGGGGDVVKVVTADGGIMELYTPITAECITGEYPGHAIFKTPTPSIPPLLHVDQLHAGQVYYLLPLNPLGLGLNLSPTLVSTPYRMSTTCNTTHNTDVWKVKLVISPQQLSHILSHHNRTEDLIDNVRTVAKCQNAIGSATKSDHSSVSGSSSTYLDVIHR